MSNDFDQYVNNYRDIINRGARITGENYEYFIQLRIQLLKNELGIKTARKNKLKILDFGCGTGVTETYLRSFFPDSIIYGVDVSTESIKEAEKHPLDNIFFSNAETLAKQFDEGFFDLIYSNGTFHHIARTTHPAVLAMLFKLLNNDGDMFIFENNPFNPLMRRAMRKNPFDKEAELITPGYLKKALRSTGFFVNTTRFYVFYPNFLKFLRPTERYFVRVPLGAQYFLWTVKINPGEIVPS
jgi:trans-aconitate methyltransferase